MKDFRHHQLLHEVLRGEELERFRQTSLDSGLACLSRQRRRRSIVRWTAWAGLPLLLGLALFLTRFSSPPPPVARPAAPPSSPSPRPAFEPAGVRLITEEELLALFDRYPGQSLALIGQPGEPPLVLLGESAETVP